MYRLRTVFTILLSLTFLSACDENGSESPAPSTNVLKGIFVDSPVANLKFLTNTQSGSTSSAGEFAYLDGEVITFSVGNIDLPSTLAKPLLTPLDLLGTTDINHSSVVNIARLLQTLDVDGNPENGIEIGSAAHSFARALELSVDNENFEVAVTNLIVNSGSVNTSLVDASVAIAHLQKSLSLNIDSTAPVITVIGDNPVTVIKGSSYTDEGATANDAVDGPVAVTSTNNIDMSTVGIYTITYSATDKAGNTASTTRAVNIITPADTSAPIITILGDNPVTVIQGSSYIDEGATANDAVDGAVVVTSTNNIDMLTLGSYTTTYSATDNAGNVANATRAVNVDSSAVPPANAGDPFLAYSDLTYAPSTGWSIDDPQKGAVVTLWGRNFGATRGESYVTVNGVNLSVDTDYVDTWAETSNPVPFLQSITFQLNSTVPDGVGTITVTAGGITSNSVPFTVGVGTISFVSSTAPTSGTDGSITNPFHCEDFKGSLGPGNIIYFRGGTYSSMCNGGKSNIWIKSTNNGGAKAAHTAIVGYPNEEVLMDSATNGHITNYNKSIVVDTSYVTIAKFHTRALESAVRGNKFGRIVGNDLVGTLQYNQGAGIVAAGSDGSLVIGNAIHGGRSQRKLDHAIYFSGCQPTVGGEASYNYIYDNDFGSPLDPADAGYGALIVDNHQELRCDSDEQLQALRVHNNLILCENFYT